MKLFCTFLFCYCFTYLFAQQLSDCGVPYIDPQTTATTSRDTFSYFTFFEETDVIHAYYVDINAFGGQQVDRTEVFAILPDSSRKSLSNIAFGNCLDCLTGFTFVYEDSVYVENVRDVDEIDLWTSSFGQPEFSLRNNLQTLSGAGRLSGTLPLCVIGLEVRYDVFNNTTSSTTEFSTQIVCPEVVQQCIIELTSTINCAANELLLEAEISETCLPDNARLFWSNENGEVLGEGKILRLPFAENTGTFSGPLQMIVVN